MDLAGSVGFYHIIQSYFSSSGRHIIGACVLKFSILWSVLDPNIKLI